MVLSLESFIQSDKEQHYSMMVHLQSCFSLFLPKQITKASVEGNVSGVIDEVSPPPICQYISICLSIYLLRMCDMVKNSIVYCCQKYHNML